MRRFRPNWSSTGPLRQLRELEIARRMPDSAGSSPALHGMRPDLSIITGEAFSLLAPSRSQPDQVSRRPSSISNLANENEQPPVLTRALDDPSLAATSVAILSLLHPRESLRHSPAGHRLDVWHFLH